MLKDCFERQSELFGVAQKAYLLSEWIRCSLQGHQGNSGASGSKGEPGNPGIPGMAGLSGPSGLKGTNIAKRNPNFQPPFNIPFATLQAKRVSEVTTVSLAHLALFSLRTAKTEQSVSVKQDLRGLADWMDCRANPEK